MLPESSRPTSLPKRRVQSAVPTVAPFHQVKVLDQNPMGRCLCPVGAEGARPIHPHGLQHGGTKTLSPARIPSSAARPPGISITSVIGSPDDTGVSSSGLAVTMRAIVRSDRTKIMSSGISVFFIQKDTCCGGPYGK